MSTGAGGTAGDRRRPSVGWTSSPTLQLVRAACARRGTRRCGPSPRRARSGRRRARARASVEVELIVGALFPTAARRCGPAMCGSSVLGRLLARALQPVDLLVDGVARLLGQRHRARRPWRGTRSTTSSSPSPSSLRIAASCWRSRYSRCCLSIPSVTSARICCGDLQFGEVVLGPGDDQLDTLTDVDRLRARRACDRGRPRSTS